MIKRRRFRQTETLDQRLANVSATLHEQADKMPPGVERDEVQRKARQADVAAHMNEWLTSPGLQPPQER